VTLWPPWRSQPRACGSAPRGLGPCCRANIVTRIVTPKEDSLRLVAPMPGTPRKRAEMPMSRCPDAKTCSRIMWASQIVLVLCAVLRGTRGNSPRHRRSRHCLWGREEGGQRGTPAQLPITGHSVNRPFIAPSVKRRPVSSWNCPFGTRTPRWGSICLCFRHRQPGGGRSREFGHPSVRTVRGRDAARRRMRGVEEWWGAIYAPALILRPRRDTRSHHIVTLRGTSHRCSHRQ
jgi:hypothetical protein